MADHKAEQIMVAFTAAVTGLATTGTNVKRDRVYPFTSLPALSVFQGDDVPVPYVNRNYSIDDFTLNIIIEIHVSNPDTTPISTTLNQIRKEIIIAIQADPLLGLSSFVLDTEEGTASRPLIEHVDKTNATQQMDFTVKYRRSRLDPSI